MHYFIDGYNFLFRLYEEVDPLRQKREEVLSLLHEKLKKLKLKMTIVFDSHHADNGDLPTRFDHLSLEVIYTPTNQTADAYILEALSWKKNCSQELVITSDKRLAKHIEALGARVQSIEDFIEFLLKKEKNVSPSKAPLQESPEEFARLLEAFEKRFKKEQDF